VTLDASGERPGRRTQLDAIQSRGARKLCRCDPLARHASVPAAAATSADRAALDKKWRREGKGKASAPPKRLRATSGGCVTHAAHALDRAGRLSARRLAAASPAPRHAAVC
jgi:hypothetical protein